MGRKRKNPSFSDEIDYDGEADDVGYDLRLVRRWKRRCVANKDIKLNSVGKNSFNEGKYSEASKKPQANCVNFEIDDDNGEDFVDADYKIYLDSLSSVLTGDDNRTFDSGNNENMSLQTDSLNNDADTRKLESNDSEIGGDGGEGMYAYYRSYLDILGLEDENANFVDRRFDVNADNGFVKKCNSGDELVGNKFVNNDAYDANNSNKKKSNSDCMDGVAVEIDANSIENGTDCMDGVAVEIDANSIENGTFGNFSEDSGRIDVDAGAFQTQSANNHTSQNDDLDEIDPEYDFFLKNMRNDENGTSSNISEDSGHVDVDGGCFQTLSGNNDTFQNDDLDDSGHDDFLKNVREDGNGTLNNSSDGGSFQTRFGNNDTSQTDHLDNNDPDYEFFLRNVRKDGTSFVLEIPAGDGISHIIKYEVGDGSRVENPETSRSSQEGSFERDLLDESYDKYMKSLKNERGLVVYMPENGPKVVYDEDVESLSDSDVVILDTNPFSHSQIHHIPTDDEGCNKGASKSDCWFREKVMEILRKPFDLEEYKRLLDDVKVHKPVTEERDMRYGRSRTRVTHTMGKSYLEVHKDLNRKICSAGSNTPKVLNLLRGFFYWLQNTPHDVFKPWEDELCLQVLPSEGRRVKKENIC